MIDLTLLVPTTQSTPSGCLNSRLRKCVTLVISTKSSLSCFYAVQTQLLPTHKAQKSAHIDVI